jgi:hypothetical protein
VNLFRQHNQGNEKYGRGVNNWKLVGHMNETKLQFRNKHLARDEHPQLSDCVCGVIRRNNIKILWQYKLCDNSRKKKDDMYINY